MTPTTVLYDGWPLVYEPNSPAALHLDLLLRQDWEDLQTHLAVPGDLPDWQSFPETVRYHQTSTHSSIGGKFRWVQRHLPALGTRLQVDLIHLSHASPPLFKKVPTLISPAAFPSEESPGKGLAERLYLAFGQGGLARASGLLWPADLPKPTAGPATILLTPYLSPDYIPKEAPERPPPLAQELPETYILYHGPCTSEALKQVLGVWQWAAPSIGELYPLVLAGVNPDEREQVAGLIHNASLESFCRILPILPAAKLPALYQGCSALLHPAPSAPWGSSLRRAMACGRPVVTIESPLSDALVGPAGYVLPAADLRRLGAALITVIVEESVADKLGELGRARATHWQGSTFGTELREIYLRIAGKRSSHTPDR